MGLLVTTLVSLCLSAAEPTPPASAPPAPAAAETVVVGAYLNDIHNLDLQTHSFAADVYVWFRWRDASLDPAATAEFMNGYELWGHTRAREFEQPQRAEDGTLYQVLRVQGRFGSKFVLDDYPFDRHTLRLEFEDLHSDEKRLRYVADGPGLTLSPTLVLPGFRVDKPRLSVLPVQHPTTFGDPAAKKAAPFSRVRIEVDVERPAFPGAVKHFLPVLCVVLAALLMFLFATKYVEARAGLGITALLTLVALQITLNDDLPDIEYLVLMDRVYLVAYAAVILSLVGAVAATRRFERGDEPGARRLDKWSLAVISSATVVALAVVVAAR